MKRIVFLIIATLLVLGLVLPGCGEETPVENVIKIAVVGPMTDLQGQNHKDGAEMAVEEINGAGGIDVGGTSYDVELVLVETEESTEGEDGSTGSANLENVIDDVTFCVGGFRTEVVNVYREVAIDNDVLFMNCGAATGSLQFSVVTNYDKYKYWFKSTPYNETFLVKSCLKMTATIGAVLQGTLATLEATNSTYVKTPYKLSTTGGKITAHILMEDATWCAGMVAAAEYYLPNVLGFTVTGTTLVSPTAADITTELTAIAALNPHIIFTAFSGSVGAVYSNQKNDLGIPAVTIGINVPGQQLSHWVNTDGDCEGEIMLDTWAEGLENTSLTADWFDDYMTRTERYPVYTAGTYDAIKAVCGAIDDTNSLDSDVLVAWLEDVDNAYLESVASPIIMYYPMPEIEITAGELYALNESQVTDYYDLASYGWTYNSSEWLCGFVTGVQQPHIAHDLVYGPGLVTGVGSQWQKLEGGTGTPAKVGIWPLDLGPSYDVPLTDQYGCWNFAYPGTSDYILTIGGMLNIPWDPYA
jgi:branched-chain amino acid transport system substrate-binding protein